MKLSEEQLRSILQQTQVKIEADLQLEDRIITEINNTKHYEQLILRSKRRAAIGLWACLAITVCLIISLLHNLFSNSLPELGALQGMLPSFMVIVILLTLHQLLYFGIGLRKKIEA